MLRPPKTRHLLSDRPRTGLKRVQSWFLLFCLAAILGSAYVVYDVQKYSNLPASDNTEKTVILIPNGQGFKSITNILYEHNIIKSPIRFMLLARYYGFDKRIKAGEYVIDPMMTPLALLNLFVSGKVLYYKITIPEGYTVKQIASLVSASKLLSEEDFMNAAQDIEFIKRLGIQSNSLEGYLFPDTYYFQKTISANKMISAMVDRFNEIWSSEWTQQAQHLGYSVHEIITLASIIEKETGVPSERPLISSVFHNRLKRGMRLDSDPTVIYGIKDYDGNLTKFHLKAMTPYNTYQIKGLPPGPIANPGKDAIRAALFPENTQYLYFVSKNDKTHEFSTNINDHNRAVHKYQK